MTSNEKSYEYKRLVDAILPNISIDEIEEIFNFAEKQNPSLEKFYDHIANYKDTASRPPNVEPSSCKNPLNFDLDEVSNLQ